MRRTWPAAKYSKIEETRRLRYFAGIGYRRFDESHAPSSSPLRYSRTHSTKPPLPPRIADFSDSIVLAVPFFPSMPLARFFFSLSLSFDSVVQGLRLGAAVYPRDNELRTRYFIPTFGSESKNLCFPDERKAERRLGGFYGEPREDIRDTRASHGIQIARPVCCKAARNACYETRT